MNIRGEITGKNSFCVVFPIGEIELSLAVENRESEGGVCRNDLRAFDKQGNDITKKILGDDNGVSFCTTERLAGIIKGLCFPD